MRFLSKKGTWFYFNDEKPDEGRICLRNPSFAEIEDVRQQTVTHEVEYKRLKKREPLQRFEYDVIDSVKNLELLWDIQIVDWENVEDEKGKPLKCTRENKLRLFREEPAFLIFVGNCMEMLSEELPTAEDLEKNSSKPLNS